MIPSNHIQNNTTPYNNGQQGTATVTMTSLEIVADINEFRRKKAEEAGAAFPSKGFAELRHDSFMAKVPEVLGEKDAQNFLDIYLDAYGREKPCYRFPKREACLMAMSYSYELQAQVFDKMTAQEERERTLIDPMQILSDPAALRVALLGYTEKVIALESKVQEQAPKVAALERITASEGLMNLQTAGKVLQQPPNKFIKWLDAQGWIYKRPGSSVYLPKADKQRAGYLTTKTTEVHMPDGTSRQRPQCLVEPAGLVQLAKILNVSTSGDLFAG